jgi:hypothetical protein
MDKARAIEIFQEQLEQMTRLPLITDAEMDALFGEEMKAAVDKLACLEQEKHLCRDCQKRCCPAVKCELYAPQFPRCPIHEFRPPICRLHYCHRFFEDDDTLLKEMSDVFFDCLLTADRCGSGRVRYFDTPPLARCCPALVAKVEPWIKAVKEGTLDSVEGLKLINEVAASYRTGV